MSSSWKGFDGRIFLTNTEHETYLRRPPVRYSARGLVKPNVCTICGKPPLGENGLQAAHKVPFISGVLKWKFTPDWLDSPNNLVWAHKVKCNRSAEMSDKDIAVLVSSLKKSSKG